jgi:hypothetical protein
MHISRLYTASNTKHPKINSVATTSEIKNPDGTVVFSLKDMRVPDDWSQVACDVLAQKYFRKAGVPSGTKRVVEGDVPEWLQRSVPVDGASFGGETSANQVFKRLAGTWTYWGWKGGYFGSPGHRSELDARSYYDEMIYMLAKQIAAPNSPQWFNTGLHWAYGIDGISQGHYYVDDLIGWDGVTACQTPQLTASASAYERPQPSACQPGRSWISTPQGPVRIGDVARKQLIGLKVFDKDGTTSVEAAVSKGFKKVYRTLLANGNYVETTEDHEILACHNYDHNNKNNQKWVWTPTSNLQPGMKLLQRGDTSVKSKKASPLELAEALLAGAIQGDGFQHRTM